MFDSEQLRELLSAIPNCEVVSLDNLPRVRLKNDYYCALNTQHSKLPGGHWLGMAIKTDKNSQRVIYCFDSLSLPPVLSPQIDFINKQQECVEFNKYAVQGQTSTACGLFVAAFLWAIYSGLEYESFLSAFDSNYVENEVKARTMLDSMREKNV
jgi:hypothetical protein